MGDSEWCSLLDCRAVNRRFRQPPPVALAAGYSWARLELPEHSKLYVAQSDIKDYFYSLSLPEDLRSMFCLPPVPIGYLKRWQVSSSMGGELPGQEGWIWPSLGVVPMGWNWATYLAQRVHQEQILVATGISSSRILVDSAPAPSLENGEPVIIPYADNLNVCGTDEASVQQTKGTIVKHLRGMGFRVHEELDSSCRAQSLSFLIDGSAGVVTPIPDKLQKVRGAFSWLSRRPRVNGKAIEKLVGHATHFMLLRRELLCIFHATYRFIQECYCYSKRARLWPSVAREAKWACRLLGLCSADLRKTWHDRLTASDASLSGIAVCSRDLPIHEIKDIARYKEAWRFKVNDRVVNPRKSALPPTDIHRDPFSDPNTVKPLLVESEAPFVLNYDFPEISSKVMDKDNWQLRFNVQMTIPEHMTLLEGRGMLASVRHKLRSVESFGKRHLHLNDNWEWCWLLRRGDHLHLVCCVFVVGFARYTLHLIPHFHTDGFQVNSMWQMLAPEFGNLFGNHKMLLGTPKKSPKKCRSIGLHTQGDPSLANMEFPILLPELDMHQSGSSKAILRRMLDGKSKEEISKKRKTFQESRTQKKRFTNQTLLEQEAISNEVANNYMIRTQAFRVFVKQERLSVKGENNLDNALTYYLNYLFEEGHDLGDGTKTLAAVLDSNPGCGQRTRLPRSPRLESSGSTEDSTPIALGAGGIDCIRVGKGRPYHRVSNSFTEFRGLSSTRGSPFDQKTGSHPSKPQLKSLCHQPPPLKPRRGIQDGTFRRMHFVGLKGDTMVVPRIAQPEREERVCTSSHQPSNSSKALAKHAAEDRSFNPVCSTLPAASCRSQPRQVDKGKKQSGSQASRTLDIRCVSSTVRETCLGGSSVPIPAQEDSTSCNSSPGGSLPNGPKVFRPKSHLEETWVIEIFSGCARFSRACSSHGFHSIAYDIDYGTACDVTNIKVLSSIFRFIRSHRVALVWLGTPCQSWSMARRDDGGPPPLRSDAFLMGKPGLSSRDKSKVEQGNLFLEISFEICMLCISLNIAWVMENPFTSRIWATKRVQQLIQEGASLDRIDFCAYGMPWRKATGLLHWNFHNIVSACQTCVSHCGRCGFSGRKHIILSGTDASGQWLTRVAQPYPHKMCQKIAGLLAQMHRMEMGGLFNF